MPTSPPFRLSAACGLLVWLAACGGGSAPVTGVSASGLKYTGSLAAVSLQFSGNALDNSIKVYANDTACTVLSASSASSRSALCFLTVPRSLKLPIRVTSAADYTVYSTTLDVPAPQVSFQTSMGDFVLELDPRAAPITVNNFLAYVNQNPSFYVGTLFHRVISGFVVQGGGFLPGMNAKTGLRTPITLESNNGLSNDRGTVAMARSSDPNSATSQFYINLVNNSALNYSSASAGYAVFGRVVSGMAVIDQIGIMPTITLGGYTDVPETDIAITSASQTQ